MPNYWFDHVHVISPDPIKTAEFYEKLLGAKRGGVGKFPDGSINVDLDLKGTTIKIRQPREKPLLPSASPAGCALEHFGVRTDNIETAVGELKTNGIKFVQEITQSPGLKASFFVAPGDVLIELSERSSPSR